MTKEELEEMAEDYALTNWEWYESGQRDYIAIKQAFLAGLKAGRMKEEMQKLKEDNEDLKQSLDWANEREKENTERIAALEKENDELKDEIESNRDLPTIAYMQGAEKQKKKDEALLTKAKNLLRELYVKARYSPFSMGEHKNILTEVLEFLQEE